MADIVYVFGVIASLALVASVAVMLYFTFAAGHAVEPEEPEANGDDDGSAAD